MVSGMSIFGRLKSLAYPCVMALAFASAGDANAARIIRIPQSASRSARAEPAAAKPIEIKVAAHPAMFRLAKGKSTVYLLGSIHVLPVNYSWHTPVIDKAVASADAFIFETNVDFATSEFDYYLKQHGYLPVGKTLHEMLSPEAQKQYAEMIATLHIDPNKLDYLQPGVALMMLQRSFGPNLGQMQPGVDAEMGRYAKDHGKDIGYLESLQSQFDLLAKLGGGAQVKLLEKQLANWRDDSDKSKFPKMLAAWATGDLQALQTFDDEVETEMRPLLLDNRNRAWIPRIESMLDVPGTYFVTVGARHLTGDGSVIDLLCAKHWNVERVKTGDAAVPPACSSDIRAEGPALVQRPPG